MTILCDNCEKKINVDTDRSYTVIDNVTGKRRILCFKCVNEVLQFKRVNSILREAVEKFQKKGKQ